MLGDNTQRAVKPPLINSLFFIMAMNQMTMSNVKGL